MSDTALEIKEKHPSLQGGTQLCLTAVSFESTVLLLGKLSFVRFDPSDEASGDCSDGLHECNIMNSALHWVIV